MMVVRRKGGGKEERIENFEYRNNDAKHKSYITLSTKKH